MNGVVQINHFQQDGTVSIDEILHSVSALDTKDIIQFMHEMGKIVANRNANVLSKRESELLKSINQAIPKKLQDDYQNLNIKLNDETISEQEYQLLLKIIDRIERKRAKKLEFMVELARLRNISLQELGQQLQVNSVAYA